MVDKAVKSWLDIAPAYMNFMLKFVRDPRQAFSKVAGSADVSSDLTSILLGGVALSYLIVVLGGSPGLKQDPGRVAGLLRGLDYQVLPILAVFVTLALAVMSHVSGKFYAALSRRGRTATAGRWDPKLAGSIEDSVNAGLGFAAVYVPLAAAVICVSSWLPTHSSMGASVGGLLLAVFLVIYFPWSLSSTHRNTRFGQAFLAFGGGIVLVLVVLGLLRIW
jgi:hypothetical protein